MAVNTYTAQKNYYDPSYGWGNESTACQGSWTGTGGNRTGVIYFPGLAALKGKIINSVVLRVTTSSTGYNASKTAKFYASASQGGIKTSLGAGHKTGSQIGSVTATMYNNSSSFTITFLTSRIAAGEDTFCIYDTGTTNYFKWSAVTLEVNWSEPATQPTLSSATVAMGSSVTIGTAATSSAYRHTLRYAFGSATGTIASSVASSYAWTVPLSLASQIPSATSGIGTVYCDTYSGTTLLGTKSVGITLTVPASVVPSAGTLTSSISSDTSGTGTYVKGMCRARLRLASYAGVYGSTITSIRISGGGWGENDADMTTGVINTAGTITFTATVTDSRGRSTSTTRSITVADYNAPRIASCNVYRCNSSGTRSNTDTYAAVEISATYTAITGNALTLKAAYKLSTASSYGTAVNVTNGGKTVIGGGALSTARSYDIKITVADKYNTFDIVRTVPTKSTIFSALPGLGFAIGKVAELTGWFDVQFNTRLRQNLQVDGEITWPTKHQITYQAIPTGSDLNNYRTPGYYRSQSGSNTITNKPTSSSPAFELIVTSIGGRYSTQTIKNHANNKRWTRTQTNWTTPDTWTDWEEIRVGNGSLTASSLSLTTPLAVASGGTGASTAAAARSNLGVGSTLLWSGSITSGSLSLLNAWGGAYKAYAFVGSVGGNALYSTLFVPYIGALMNFILPAQSTDYWNLSVFGNELGTMGVTLGGSGTLNRIYGIN